MEALLTVLLLFMVVGNIKNLKLIKMQSDLIVDQRDMINNLISDLKARDKKTIASCKDCEGKPCICEYEDKWAAHCMDCDNSIGEPGVYDACADSEEEAIERWNELNRKEEHGGE